MKFSINKKDLLIKLQLLSKATPQRTTLPIIGKVVLDGIAFDNNCSFFNKVFLSMENFIFYPIW